jgi:hypothetical protein
MIAHMTKPIILNRLFSASPGVSMAIYLCNRDAMRSRARFFSLDAGSKASLHFHQYMSVLAN